MTDNHQNFGHNQLRSYISRVEALEEEKASIATDIKEVYAEAKASGFDTKTMKKVVSLRKKDATEREEEEAVLALYMTALGMSFQGNLFVNQGAGGAPHTQDENEQVDLEESVKQAAAEAGVIVDNDPLGIGEVPEAPPVEPEDEQPQEVAGDTVLPDHDAETGEINEHPASN